MSRVVRLLSLAVVVVAVPIAVAACKKSGVDHSGPLTLSSAECRALYDQAGTEMTNAWNRASKVCAKDEDCVAASRTPCFVTDCSFSPIAASAMPAFQRDRVGIDAERCEPFNRATCLAKIPIPMPSCPLPHPACSAGQCVNRN